MIGTSKNINFNASAFKSDESGFFARGEAAQEKLYTVEYVPSSPGEWGLFFALLSLPHAAAGILPNCPEMAHSATVRVSHHRTTGNCKTAHRSAVWAPLASGSLRAAGPQTRNLLKPIRKVNYGPKSQQCTKENEQ